MYVLHVEQLERRVAVDAQIAVALIARGADLEIPNAVVERERFDAALIAEPAPLTGVSAFIRELGVA